VGSLRKWNKIVIGRGAVGLVEFCGSEVLSVKIWKYALYSSQISSGRRSIGDYTVLTISVPGPFVSICPDLVVEFKTSAVWGFVPKWFFFFFVRK
jgi:hypothetical protein